MAINDGVNTYILSSLYQGYPPDRQLVFGHDVLHIVFNTELSLEN